ncbi:MAG: GGDEF domain-containing protein [Acetivibrionales bacterium]|jgi:diguanylate cyclase (GGDEF)-like protein
MYRHNTSDTINQKNSYKILMEIISYIGKTNDINSACRFVCNNMIKLGFNNCIIINQLDGRNYSNQGSTNADFLIGRITDKTLKETANGYKIIDLGYSSYRTKLGFLYINRIKRNNELSGYLVLSCYSRELFNHSMLSLIDTLITYLGVCFENMQVVNTIKQTIYMDELTGLHNRKYLEELRNGSDLEKALKLSVIMIDIDNFKNINDTYGHQFGDFVLKGLSEVLQDELNGITDSIVRYGGEEFLVILPGWDMVQAARIAENIRVSFYQRPFASNYGEKHFSISLGVSTSKGKHNFNRILELADISLYLAKRKGRNCVVQCTEEISAKYSIVDYIGKLKNRNKNLITCYKIEFDSKSVLKGMEQFDDSLCKIVKQCFRKDSMVSKTGNAEYIAVTDSKLSVEELKNSLRFHFRRLNMPDRNTLITSIDANEDKSSLESFIGLV